MRNSKCEIRNFFLHKCALLLLLVLLLPLTGCTLSEELLTEKRRVQPFPEGTTAIIFEPRDGSADRIVTDERVIAALQEAYRWTNYHAFCCLEGEVTADITVYVNGQRHPAERQKLYADLSVPSFNREFRELLRQVWLAAPEA